VLFIAFPKGVSLVPTTAAAAVWLLRAGRCWSCLSAFQHVLTRTASTVTYDQAEHCPIYAHESGLIARLLGAVIEAVNAYGVKLLRI
jgi:hypothetical protein